MVISNSVASHTVLVKLSVPAFSLPVKGDIRGLQLIVTRVSLPVTTLSIPLQMSGWHEECEVLTSAHASVFDKDSWLYQFNWKLGT